MDDDVGHPLITFYQENFRRAVLFRKFPHFFVANELHVPTVERSPLLSPHCMILADGARSRMYPVKFGSYCARSTSTSDYRSPVGYCPINSGLRPKIDIMSVL